MIALKTDPRQFLRSEGGAVTVDWVVLTAALVGLGLATMSVVRNGIADLSSDVDSELRGMEIQTVFARLRNLAEMDFSDGAGDWFGGTVTNLPGFGDVLQLSGGETAELSVDVPDGAGSATISFDMIAADDLNGDPATIFVNGQAVSIYTDDHGNVNVSNGDVEGISVSVDHQFINKPEGAGDHGHDSRATYTITVDDPGSSLTLGVSSGSDESIGKEFYAIDDVSITSS
ncbi:MAG: hypothetical protein AAGF30_10850 [Pseudomonadota bacterium]